MTVTASILIAKFLGPLLLFVGLLIAVGARGVQAPPRNFIANPGLLLAGILTLLGGLAIVAAAHMFWAADWRIVDHISVIVYGWLIVSAGMFRIAFALQSTASSQLVADRMLAQKIFIRMTVGAMLVLGAYLAWKGYS